MRKGLSLWLGAVLATASLASGNDSFEDPQLVYDSAVDDWRVVWNAKPDRTYFLQICADDELKVFTYACIERAAPGQSTLSVSLNVVDPDNDPNTDDDAVRIFARLRWSTQPVPTTDDPATPLPIDETDPNYLDFDGDLLLNGDEIFFGTDPLSWDTDGDGISDSWELNHNMGALDPGTGDPDNGPAGDIDNDGTDNYTEYKQNADLDGDGLGDTLDAHPGVAAINWTKRPFMAYDVIEIGPRGDLGYPIDVNDRGDILFERHVWPRHGSDEPLTAPDLTGSPAQYWDYTLSNGIDPPEIVEPISTLSAIKEAILVGDDDLLWVPNAINNRGEIVGNAGFDGVEWTTFRGLYWNSPAQPPLLVNPSEPYWDSMTAFYDILHDGTVVAADSQRFANDLTHQGNPYSIPGVPDRYERLAKWRLGGHLSPVVEYLFPMPQPGFPHDGFNDFVASDHGGFVLLSDTLADDALNPGLFFAPNGTDFEDAALVHGEHPFYVGGVSSYINGTTVHDISGSQVSRSGLVLHGSYLLLNGYYRPLEEWVEPDLSLREWRHIEGDAISDSGVIAGIADKVGAGGGEFIVLLVPRGEPTHFQASADDATGPRYRKVSLTGRPIPDEKPQATSETDAHKEQTYIDAFNRTLNHHASDIYIPIGGSDLVLQVTRTYREEIWNDRHGLRPGELPNQPFGCGWTTNLSVTVEVVETSNPGGGLDPVTVRVADEEGRMQRFATYDGDYYFPMPSGRVEKKRYMNTLTRSGNTFTYKKKFGNTLTYEFADSWNRPADRGSNAGPGTQHHHLYRLTEVQDKYGNKLIYHYPDSERLFPDLIYDPDRSDVVVNGNSYTWTSGLALRIEAVSNHYIQKVTDPRGLAINYHYHNESLNSGWCKLLKSVAPPGFSVVNPASAYVYDDDPVIEADNHPRAYGTPPRPVVYEHFRLKKLTDANGNDYEFDYIFDTTKEAYHEDAISANKRYIQTGQPSLIRKVTLPAETGTLRETYFHYSGEAGFVEPEAGVTSPATHLHINDKFGKEVSAYKRTYVKDAAGHERWYTFTETDVIRLDQLPGNQRPDEDDTSSELIVSYQRMEIQAGDLGSETYEFNPDAGYALSRATDFSGNVTSYAYGDLWDAPPEYRHLMNVGKYGYFDDPTEKVDALGQVTRYEYDPAHRVLSKVTGVDGSTTEYNIDPVYGRRTKQTVKDKAGATLQETDFGYHTSLPNFLVTQTIKDLDHVSQSWIADRVTTFTPYLSGGKKGRVYQEIVATGGTPLTTSYDYDPNGNRTSVTDPRLHTTSFEFDDRNRLEKIVYPGAGTPNKEFKYDANGNRVAEKDERGLWTVFEYDELNRLERRARDMNRNAESNGNFTIDGPDLTTVFTYYHNGLLESVTNPRGHTTTHFYDDAYRKTETRTPHTDATPTVSTKFFYDGVNPGSSLFNSEGWKPTRIEGPRLFDTIAEYDALYRPTLTKAEYETGQFTEVVTTYDDVNRTVTVQEKVTNGGTVEWLASRTTNDPLGRAVETITALGDPLEEQVTTHAYTSTGLRWQTLEHSGKDPGSTGQTIWRETRYRYDDAGRQTHVISPDPDTGAISNQSPVAYTVYDPNSNVVAVTDPRGMTKLLSSITQNSDHEDYTTYYQYDERNRRVGEASPKITATTETTGGGINHTLNTRSAVLTQYDSVGNVTGVVDPRGTTFTLSGNDLTVSEANSAYKTTTVFDDANRPDIVTAPSAPEFTSIGVEGTAAAVTEYEYDPNGNVIEIEDPEDNVTLMTYDRANRLLTTKIDPSDGAPAPGAATGEEILVTNGYDHSGNLVSVTDGLGAVTKFTFDGLGRRTAMIVNPNSSEDRTTYTYNEAYLTKRTDENGATDRATDYTYDTHKRLKETKYDGRSQDDHTRHYDLLGNLTSVTYAGAGDVREVGHEYDFLDRPTSETSAGHKHEYEYDKTGNRTKLTYKGGRVVDYVYDGLNRLTSADDSAESNDAQYWYDAASNRIALDLPNGTRTLCQFDARNQEQRTTVWSPDGGSGRYRCADNRYAYDLAGNLREHVERFNKGSSTEQAHDRIIEAVYDHAYRLKEHRDHDVTFDDPNDGYEIAEDAQQQPLPPRREELYDFNQGHQLTDKTVEIDGSVNHSVEYDYGLAAQNHNANQLSKETHRNAGGSVTQTLTYGYDNFGNRTGTSGGLTETVSYDYENRILSVTHAGTTSTYQHDYRSRRVVRNEGSSTRTVTYAGGTSLQEYDGATRKVQYVRGSDLGGGVGGILYSAPEGDDARYFHYNTRGDVTVKTPASGAVSDLDYVASYGVFGDVLFETHANEDPQGPNTKEVGGHGIIHEGFRDRKGHTFYQRDPLGFVDTSNLYAYAANNPRTHFDAHGLTIDELGDERLLSGWEAIDKIREEGGFYLPRWYDDLVTQHKDPWLHAAYSLGGRSAVETYIENFDKAMQLGEILGTFGLTMTPGAGEAMDINILTDPNASGFAKSMAAGSLALNAITLTLAPNVGKPLQGLEEGIPSVPTRSPGGGPDDSITFYHGTSTSGAANIRANGIDLSYSRAETDFGLGFYTTTSQSQAQKWAARNGGEVLEFRVSRQAFEGLDELNLATKTQPSLFRFFRHNRLGGRLHSHDIVSGPMLGNPRQFLKGTGGRAFGQQTSFHTQDAIDILSRGLQR